MQGSLLGNLVLDQDTIYNQIQAYIASYSSIGSSLYPSDVGTMMAQLPAGLLAHVNYRLETWINNSYMGSAYIPSAIYSIACMLGSPPRRYVGSSVQVQLTLTTAYSFGVIIPAYSVFSCNGLFWYNSEDISIIADQTQVNFTIYQGQENSETFSSDGTSFQQFKLKTGSFTIDENSIKVRISPDSWTKEKVSLITHSPTSTVFKEQTNPDGTVTICFGNNTFGMIPQVNSSIVISYYISAGLSSNFNTTGLNVSLISNITLQDSSKLNPKIITTSTATGGDNQENPNTVKNTAPRNFASNNRGVTRNDYLGFLLKYPNIADAVAWGEFEETIRQGQNNPSIRNNIFFTAVQNTTSTQLGVGGVITLGVTNYQFNIGSTNFLKGSLYLEVGNTDYYDITNYLVSDDISSNILVNGNSSCNSNTASNPSSNLFDNNTSTYFQSNTLPTNINPVIVVYDLGSGNAIDFAAIRFLAATLSDFNNRATPSSFKVYGSNTSGSDINNDSQWKVLSGTIVIPELGSSQYSDWFNIGTYPDTYRYIRICFYGVYGTSSNMKLSEIQVQSGASLSSINYQTGVVSLMIDPSFSLSPVGSNINYSYISPDFTNNQITLIQNYMSAYMFMNCNLNYVPPVVKIIDINLNVYYFQDVIDPNLLQATLVSSIQDLFTIKNGYIGKSIMLSDISKTILANSNVDFCDILTPTQNLIIMSNQILQVNEININMFKSLRN